MADLKAALEAYGADYERTMARFMGNESMYLRFLGMLFEDENLAKLGDALAAGDYTAAFEAGHTLKGVAGNMGLDPLCDAVCAIVEPLRVKDEGADYARLYAAIQAQFLRVAALRDGMKGEI